MAKKSYKIKKAQKIEDILAGLSIRFLSHRVEAPKKEGVEWITGLIDNEEDTDIHYIRCESHTDAVAIVHELVTVHGCVRGINVGANQTIVYLSCEDV